MSNHVETTASDGVEALGTILSIWAHPDDETHLAGGLMAAAAQRGQRVVCVLATAGERGAGDPAIWPPERLGLVRRLEVTAALAILGVREHHILGRPDGALADDDEGAIRMIEQLIDEIDPDTIVTFGPDGTTFHPDHIAVHHWVTEAWQRTDRRSRLLYAMATSDYLRPFRDVFDDLGVYMADIRPVGVRADDLAVHVRLDGPELDYKLTALRAMATQTSSVIARVDAVTYAAMAAEEFFVDASRLLVHS